MDACRHLRKQLKPLKTFAHFTQELDIRVQCNTPLPTISSTLENILMMHLALSCINKMIQVIPIIYNKLT